MEKIALCHAGDNYDIKTKFMNKVHRKYMKKWNKN